MCAVANTVQPDIQKDIRSAMPGETKSWLMYEAFGDQAASAGHEELAAVWRIISQVERYDHFYKEAHLHGYLGGSMQDTIDTALQLAGHQAELFS